LYSFHPLSVCHKYKLYSYIFFLVTNSITNRKAFTIDDGKAESLSQHIQKS
jgi:hypothetical protein